MRQIVYFSTAAGRQDAIAVAALMAVMRDHDPREQITGMLVAGGHRYLHVIEGPPKTVEALMGQLRRDQRHVGVTVLVNRKIAARSFAGTSVALGDEPEFDNFETFHQVVGRMRAALPDPSLREQLDCFERRFAVAAIAPVASPWTLATSYKSGLTLDRSH